MKKTITGPAQVEINGQVYKYIGDIHVEMSDVEGIMMDREIEREVNHTVKGNFEFIGHVPCLRELGILTRPMNSNPWQAASDFDYMTARGWKLNLITGRYHR